MFKVAPRKTLAKVANRLAKKDTAVGGVRLLLGEQAQREALGASNSPTYGASPAAWPNGLRAIGITTSLELRDADHRLIRERFSVVLEHMVLELRGVACTRRLERRNGDHGAVRRPRLVPRRRLQGANLT